MATHPPKTPPQMTQGDPKLRSVPFFWLLCSNNYSKIFQKRRMFKLLIGGTYVGYPPGGAPPGTPHPIQGSPGVTEFWGKLKKFPKII